MVALTNAPGPSPSPNARSRGLLVTDLLGAGLGSVDRTAVLDVVRSHDHGPFHLLVADTNGALAISHVDSGLRMRHWAEGSFVLHFLHEAPLSLAEDELPRAGMEGLAGLDEVATATADLLRSHEAWPVTGHPPCRHGETRGTVSTFELFLDPHCPERAGMLFGSGPTCEAERVECPWPLAN